MKYILCTFVSVIVAFALGADASYAATSPATTSIDPALAVPGEQVTVTGTGFDTGSYIIFDNQSLNAVETGTTQMKFTVPQGATVGVHHVTVAQGDGTLRSSTFDLSITTPTSSVVSVGHMNVAPAASDLSGSAYSFAWNIPQVDSVNLVVACQSHIAAYVNDADGNVYQCGTSTPRVYGADSSLSLRFVNTASDTLPVLVYLTETKAGVTTDGPAQMIYVPITQDVVAQTAYIKLVAPLGANWVFGNTYTIQWNGFDLNGSVNISLKNDTSGFSCQVASVPVTQTAYDILVNPYMHCDSGYSLFQPGTYHIILSANDGKVSTSGVVSISDNGASSTPVATGTSTPSAAPGNPEVVVMANNVVANSNGFLADAKTTVIQNVGTDITWKSNANYCEGLGAQFTDPNEPDYGTWGAGGANAKLPNTGSIHFPATNIGTYNVGVICYNDAMVGRSASLTIQVLAATSTEGSSGGNSNPNTNENNSGSSGSSTVPNSSVTNPFNRTLSRGMQGDDVRLLQEVLNSDQETTVAQSGPGSKGEETATYGPITEAAVQKFQCKYYIVCSGSPSSTGWGVVGPQTLKVLNGVYNKLTHEGTTSIGGDQSTASQSPAGGSSMTTATSSQPQTVQDLQAEVDQLTELIDQLQSQLSTASSSAAVGTSTPVHAPVITSTDPGLAVPGMRVTVSGSGFDSGSYMLFDKQPLNTTIVSSTKMTFIVPQNATAGPHYLLVAEQGVTTLSNMYTLKVVTPTTAVSSSGSQSSAANGVHFTVSMDPQTAPLHSVAPGTVVTLGILDITAEGGDVRVDSLPFVMGGSRVPSDILSGTVGLDIATPAQLQQAGQAVFSGSSLDATGKFYQGLLISKGTTKQVYLVATLSGAAMGGSGTAGDVVAVNYDASNKDAVSAIDPITGEHVTDTTTQIIDFPGVQLESSAQ